MTKESKPPAPRGCTSGGARSRVVRARIVHGFSLQVGLEELRDFQCVVHVALDAQRQGLDALLDEEGIEGRGSTANISKPIARARSVREVCSELLGAKVVIENKAHY